METVCLVSRSIALLQALVFPQTMRIHFARVLRGSSEENWAKLSVFLLANDCSRSPSLHPDALYLTKLICFYFLKEIVSERECGSRR